MIKYTEEESNFVKNMVKECQYFKMETQREKSTFMNMLVYEINKRFRGGKTPRSWVSVAGKIHTIKKQEGLKCAVGGNKNGYHRRIAEDPKKTPVISVTLPIGDGLKTKQFCKVEEAMKMLADAVVALASEKQELAGEYNLLKKDHMKLSKENEDLKTLLRSLKDVREAVEKYQSSSKTVTIIRR